MYSKIIKFYCNFMLILSPGKSNIKILKDEEMVDYVLKNDLSIIRFGDGEFRIMKAKKGIHFQTYNEKLQKELENIYFDYSKSDKFLLSMPYFLNNDRKWFKSQPYSLTACFAEWRIFVRKHHKSAPYGDSFLFKKDNRKTYEKLWVDEKRLILLHNDEKWAKLLEKEYRLKVDFIAIPKKNSYEKIDELERKIREINKDKKTKILVSAGPMTKALIYRLSKDNYILYDTGHCFDEPLEVE